MESKGPASPFSAHLSDLSVHICKTCLPSYLPRRITKTVKQEKACENACEGTELVLRWKFVVFDAYIRREKA